jgi:hypothetical protein
LGFGNGLQPQAENNACDSMTHDELYSIHIYIGESWRQGILGKEGLYLIKLAVLVGTPFNQLISSVFSDSRNSYVTLLKWPPKEGMP